MSSRERRLRVRLNWLVFCVSCVTRSIVASLYPDLGFVAAAADENCWEYDLAANGPIESDYIADDHES